MNSYLKKHNYTTAQFKREYPECYVSHDEDKIIWENEFDLNNYANMISTVNSMEIVDTSYIVYCRCCLKPFKRISPYHLESHNMTIEMYKKIFPDAPLVAKNVVIESTNNFMQTYIKKNYSVGKCWGLAGKRQYPEKKICVLEKRSPEWKYLERLYKSKLVLRETGKQNIRLMPELYK